MKSQVVQRTDRVVVCQSNTATILYSSGTMGRVKGVALTHRNWMTLVAGAYAARPVKISASASASASAIALCMVPYFHLYAFEYLVRTLAMGESLVTLSAGRFTLKLMLRKIEELRISHVWLAPPVALMIVRDPNLVDGFYLSSLESVAFGGAPLVRSIVGKLRQSLT